MYYCCMTVTAKCSCLTNKHLLSSRDSGRVTHKVAVKLLAVTVV